jgi:hypothetical protein
MKSRKRICAAAAAFAAMLACVPAGASAAITGSVTGDGGAPVALPANGAATAIRNMDVQALSHVDSTDATSFNATVTDPAGVGASTPSPCWITKYGPDDKRNVDYHGNGVYKLVVTTYTDNICSAGAKTYSYSWNVQAGVALGQPATPLMTRQPNSFSTATQQLDFTQNPGALTYEIKYALGGVAAPDGSISGPVQDAYLNSTTGKVELSPNVPGTYMVVARAKAYSGYYTAWSAPVTLRLMAPFDLSSVSFPDTIGPSYQVRGILGETSARGRVSIAAAKGKHGRHFRTLGRARISSKGVFKLRFRLKKLGFYRLRFSYHGSDTVTGGTVLEVVKIRRTRIG